MCPLAKKVHTQYLFTNYFIPEMEKIKSSDLDIIRVTNYPGFSGLKAFLGFGTSSAKTGRVPDKQGRLGHPRYINKVIKVTDTKFMSKVTDIKFMSTSISI